MYLYLLVFEDLKEIFCSETRSSFNILNEASHQLPSKMPLFKASNPFFQIISRVFSIVSISFLSVQETLGGWLQRSLGTSQTARKLWESKPLSFMKNLSWLSLHSDSVWHIHHYSGDRNPEWVNRPIIIWGLELVFSGSRQYKSLWTAFWTFLVWFSDDEDQISWSLNLAPWLGWVFKICKTFGKAQFLTMKYFFLKASSSFEVKNEYLKNSSCDFLDGEL